MNLHERLEAIFAAVFRRDDLRLTDSTTPADIEGWDSLAQINLMFSIEETFGIRFEEEEFSSFDNVGDLKGVIAGKIGDAA